ncbi:hypothetical protein FGIG_03874 [Fasciola gigantica]|uniref:LTD domain-containing protein n=1 Tax=Fasciola gigantica TaxID=46835 RepID=A0A504ZCG2_FASGI|nr:hypothetical protein FGIG_03874 [Fasciola gigantica]
MNASQDNRWNQAGSYGSLDNLARSTMSLDVPEARICREAREQSRKEMHVLNEKLASQLERVSGKTTWLQVFAYIKYPQLCQCQLVDDCEREKADSLAKMATLQQNLRYAEDQIKHLTQENKKLSHQLDQALKAVSEKEADNQMLQRHAKTAEDDAERFRLLADQAKQNNEKLHAIAEASRNNAAQSSHFTQLLEENNTLKEAIEGMRKRLEQYRVKFHSYIYLYYLSLPPLATIFLHSPSTSINRWTERDEPSGQSIRSHLVERTVEGSQFSRVAIPTVKREPPNRMRTFPVVSWLSQNAHKGAFIEICNTGNCDVGLSGWCLIRNIDHGRSIIRYTFPDRRIPPHHTFRIWASGKGGPNTGFLDFEAPYSSWGTGSVVHTSLFSPDGMEKASHTQRVDYSP